MIRAGADIEAGKGDAGTPLHFAALRGNCSVMKLMIEKGSDVNAVSETIGPVINAAIRSGTVDAVRLVMSGPLVEDDGTTLKGSLLVVEADSRAEVTAFNQADPFTDAGVWEAVTITAFQKRRG